MGELFVPVFTLLVAASAFFATRHENSWRKPGSAADQTASAVSNLAGVGCEVGRALVWCVLVIGTCGLMLVFGGPTPLSAPSHGGTRRAHKGR